MLCKHFNKLWVLDYESMAKDWNMLRKCGILRITDAFFKMLGYDKVKYLESKFQRKVSFGKPPACTGKTAVYHWLYKMGYYKYYEVPCGKCEICRVERSKEWATKAWCEGEMWNNSCFITLTYDNEHLPDDRKLRRSDIQKFWKDLRYHLYKNTKHKSDIDLTYEREQLKEQYTNPEIQFNDEIKGKKRNKYPIRYLNCGEYGPKTKRPHYHAQIWNFIPADLIFWKRDRRGYDLFNSPNLSKIWGKGYVVIEYANSKTAGYIARYCTKKCTRTEEEEQRMKEKHQIEFIGASSNGFIGWTYWEKYKDIIKKNMAIIMKQNDHTIIRKIPKIMEKKWEEESNNDDYLIYTDTKCEIGKQNWQKMLEKTSLTESEYIDMVFKKKTRNYEKLTREMGDLIPA